MTPQTKRLPNDATVSCSKCRGPTEVQELEKIDGLFMCPKCRENHV